MKTEKIFTGQKLIGEDLVECPKCHKPINLRSPRNHNEGLAWFDPYRGKGKYVHYKCLSKKRLEEIKSS